jgi:L-lactate permease
VHHIQKNKRVLMCLVANSARVARGRAVGKPLCSSHNASEAPQFTLNGWFLGQLKLELT